MTYLVVLTHTSFPEQISKSTGPMTVILHIHVLKQIVRFQERMHLEKFQVDKIQNGRLSAIIHLDRPDIAEYHENRSR